jgi:hypothetical protein
VSFFSRHGGRQAAANGDRRRRWAEQVAVHLRLSRVRFAAIQPLLGTAPACFAYDPPRLWTECLIWSHLRHGSCVRPAPAVRSLSCECPSCRSDKSGGLPGCASLSSHGCWRCCTRYWPVVGRSMRSPHTLLHRARYWPNVSSILSINLPLIQYLRHCACS